VVAGRGGPVGRGGAAAVRAHLRRWRRFGWGGPVGRGGIAAFGPTCGVGGGSVGVGLLGAVGSRRSGPPAALAAVRLGWACWARWGRGVRAHPPSGTATADLSGPGWRSPPVVVAPRWRPRDDQRRALHAACVCGTPVTPMRSARVRGRPTATTPPGALAPEPGGQAGGRDVMSTPAIGATPHEDAVAVARAAVPCVFHVERSRPAAASRSRLCIHHGRSSPVVT